MAVYAEHQASTRQPRRPPTSYGRTCKKLANAETRALLLRVDVFQTEEGKQEKERPFVGDGQMMSRRAGRLEPQNPAQLSLLPTGPLSSVCIPSTLTSFVFALSTPVCLHVAIPHSAQHHGPRRRRERLRPLRLQRNGPSETHHGLS